MKLQLEHLAPYLPYKPVVTCGEMMGFPLDYPVLGLQPTAILTFANGEDESVGYCWMKFEHYPFKLVLRPLSQLIETIEHEGRRFVPMHKLKNGGTDLNQFRLTPWKGYSAIDNEEHETTYYPEFKSFNQFFRGDSRMCGNQYEKFQKLFEWHFDVFGLIDQSLAVEK